jgi:4'-phosphopantetheinyl transferase
MKQRNVPRSAWSIKTTKAGKPYIVSLPTLERLYIHLTLVRACRRPLMGYNITHAGSLVAMAFSLGRKHKVWNIGVDVVKMALPRNIQFHT